MNTLTPNRSAHGLGTLFTPYTHLVQCMHSGARLPASTLTFESSELLQEGSKGRSRADTVSLWGLNSRCPQIVKFLGVKGMVGSWLMVGAHLGAGAWLMVGAYLGARSKDWPTVGAPLEAGTWLTIGAHLGVDTWLTVGAHLGAWPPVGLATSWLGSPLLLFSLPSFLC